MDGDFITRILLSLVLGFVIGLEREITNKSAGLRTNILVCVGSCLFTVLSIYGFSTTLSIYPMGDPARVAAQILTGIGFIGAGTVLRHGTSIYGLTTAATLWITASVGMACGCGKYSMAILCVILTIATLTLIRIFERNCIPKIQYNHKTIFVTLTCPKECDVVLSEYILNSFPNIKEFSKSIGNDNSQELKISFKTECTDKTNIHSIITDFNDSSKIYSVSIQEEVK